MSDITREKIRDFAIKYRDKAQSDDMQDRIRRWKETVSRGTPDRTPVLLRINRSAKEVFPDPAVLTNDPLLADTAEKLRWDIFSSSMGDDTCIFPYFPVPAVIEQMNPPRYGVEIKREKPNEPGGAWKTVPPVTGESDLARLAMPRWRYDEETTLRNKDRLEDLLGDIIPVKLVGSAPFDATLDEVAETLMGFNELLLNVALKPDLIHKLMAYLRDHALSTIDQAEKMGILTENNDAHKYNSYTIKEDPRTPVSSKDLWLWTNSQIFGSVGPAHFTELLLGYQKPIFERFGAVSYGCCEDLTQKLDAILTIPNLEIFVCSYWTDLAKAAPPCADRDICIEWRQLASDMMGQPDWDAWDKHLRRGLELTRNQRKFIVLQEVETIEGDVAKFMKWCRLAVNLSEEMG